MRFERITVQNLLPSGSFLNIRLGVDILVEGHEDPKAAMLAAYDLTREFHKEQFPGLYDKEGNPLFKNYTGEEEQQQVIQQPKKLTGFDHWVAEINKCTTIPKPDGIEGLRMIADSNPKLKEVFNNRLKELQA